MYKSTSLPLGHVSFAALLFLVPAIPLLGDSFTYRTVNIPYPSYSQVEAVNANGTIVGNVFPNGTPPLGFVLNGSNITTFNLSTFGTLAYGINDLNQVVGFYFDATGIARGFLSSGNFATFTPINVPGAITTYPNGISDNGQIVGAALINGICAGFVLSGNTYTTFSFPGSTFTYPYAINDQGQIVGQYQDSYGVAEAFLYSGGVFTTLDPPGSVSSTGINWAISVARGINNQGQIVGYYYDTPLTFQGFLLSGGSFTDITFPGASGTSPMGLSSLDQIVGQYVTAPGANPVSFEATPTLTPEPATLGLCALTALISLFCFRGRIAKHFRFNQLE